MRPLLPLLVLAAAAAADPVVGTPWEVRRAADEVIAALAKAAADAPQLGAVLERAQRLIEEHGAELVVRQGVAVPMSEAVADLIAERGLAARFADAYAGAARRRLDEALAQAGEAGEAAVAAVAAAYPHTPAAIAASRRLADRAWDRGRISLYLELARIARDAEDPQRQARMRAALGLVGSVGPVGLPPDLDALEPMWTLPVGDPQVVAARAGLGERAPPVRLATIGAGEVAAAADGSRLLVFDPLVGQAVGGPLALGSVPLPAIQARPEPFEEGFAAVGIDAQGRPLAMAIDRAGRPLWERPWQAPAEDGALVNIAAPLAVGPVLIIAENRSADGSSTDLVCTGLDRRTGAQRWRTQVARMPRADFIRMTAEFSSIAPPALARQAGLAVALSNTGCLARIDPEGRVRRIWSYAVAEEMDGRGARRSGQIMSDGAVAVATPRDAPAAALVLRLGDAAPVPVRGDGTGDAVVAVADGAAVLAGRAVSLIDLAAAKVAWSVPQRLLDPVGAIAERAVLVAGADAVHLLRRGDGARIGAARGIGEPCDIDLSSGVAVVGYRDRLVGLGVSAALLARLTDEVARHPEDPRRLASLAALHEARGDATIARPLWLRALAAGAGPAIAERAARSLRRSLDLALADPAFPALLDAFRELAAYDPGLAAELPWWRGRRAEAVGARADAAAAFAACLAQPTRLVGLRESVAVDLHLLAAAGLARAGAGPDPLPAAAPTPPAGSAAAWTAAARRSGPVAVADGIAVGFADGALTGVGLADGAERWWRRGQRAMLGVQYSPELDRAMVVDGRIAPPAAGLPVRVLPGTAAARAGMQDGDRILAVAGKPMASFAEDLVPLITGLPPRTPLRVDLSRGGAAMQIDVVLGTDLVEPLAAGGGVVLARSLMPRDRRGDNQFFVIDLASGEPLWSTAAPVADDPRQPAPARLALGGGLVVAAEGDDAVAWTARPQADGRPAERWRLPGQAGGVRRMADLGRLLWLPGAGVEPGLLIDAERGAVLARIALPAAGAPILDGGVLLVPLAERALAAVDLGLGREIWRAPSSRILAAGGGAVLVIDESGKAAVIDRAGGALRRRLDWPGAEPVPARPGERGAAAGVVLRGPEGVRLGVADPAAGVLRGSLALPARGELLAQVASADGVAGLVRHPAGGAVLVDLDPAGALRSLQPLAHDPAGWSIIPLAGGHLLSGGAGLVALPRRAPPAPEPLPASRLPAGADLAAQAAALLPAARWTAVPGGRIAVAAEGNQALVLAQLDAGSEGLSLRLGDAGPVFDDGVHQAIDVVAEGGAAVCLQASARVGGDWRWRIAGAVPLPGDRPGTAILVQAAADRDPLARLAVSTGGGDLPWWVRAAWRPLRSQP